MDVVVDVIVNLFGYLIAKCVFNKLTCFLQCIYVIWSYFILCRQSRFYVLLLPMKVPTAFEHYRTVHHRVIHYVPLLSRFVADCHLQVFSGKV